ncbi:MAG TPA: hypothetical protein VJV97_04780, partial [Gemmatimonadaceae bacterium]|nr:hypothetical protein [Gemmatimonadaceae bacterium]
MRKIATTPRRPIVAATLLGIAACVSLSSPRGGSRNIPIVRGPYKSGAAQLVRIAVETAAKTGTISGTGKWGIIHGD